VTSTLPDSPAAPVAPLQRARQARATWLLVLVGVLVVACATSIVLGSRDVGWADIWAGLTGNTDGFTQAAVAKRVPRTALAAVAGAALAVSGLVLIESTEVTTEILSPETMIPPIGAGILALQCREGDTRIIDAVSALGDPDTHREATAERMFLHVLQGHCNSPIAGYATAGRGGELSLRACVFTPDGKTQLNAHEWAGRLDPATLGTSVAVALLRQGARDLIDTIPH